MLLIAFYGKYCSFYKLFMPNLLSQSKHEEFESNSTLQIRDQKGRRAKNAKKFELQEKFRSLRNLCSQFCMLQNFRRLHCLSCEICLMSALFIMQQCSPFCHYSPFLLFDVVTFLLHFFVSSHFIPCNSFWFWFFL